MRYLKPHYYDEFVCSAGECPDTCCAGWQIVIDEESLEKYGLQSGSFGNRLKNSIDWEEGIFCQYDRRCAFLNEENLCDLYRELGKDALCNTCWMYPRHTEEYEGLRELSLSLSCPVAADMILGCMEKVRFVESCTDEEDDFEEFDFLMFSQLEDAREVLFHILQNRSCPLELRMAASEQLALEYQIRVDEGREYEIDELLDKFERENASGTLRDFLRSFSREADGAVFGRYDRQMEELEELRKLERLRPEWDQVLDSAEKLLYQGGREHYEEICREFAKSYGSESPWKEHYEVMGEQLMMFFVYTYFCGAVYDDMVSSKMELALFSVRWICELIMARYLEKGKKLTFEDVREISWRYAREVEHSDDNLNDLEDYLEAKCTK
ncbi:MAG: flagellin lysine-N-methylase [Fusicatenibacter sp.]|nr:flagellin lysine-N-methylase [Fusicatenibacter sp.]